VPGMFFGFILQIRKGKTDNKKAKIERKTTKLKIRKEELHLQVLLEENKKYDRLLEEKGSR
jgi:hypothetical protein